MVDCTNVVIKIHYVNGGEEMRYSRQELFTPIGKEGQKKIRDKHVLVVGAGALGSANAEMLVRAGIGKLTMVDRDYVDWTNLQRQQLYNEENVVEQLPKAIAAERRLREINSEVEIISRVMDADRVTLEPLLDNVSVIVDATDNFDIRFIVNDLAQKHNIPWVFGSCVGSYGMNFTFMPGKTPCLQCLLKTIPMSGMTCDTVGILSPVVQIVSSYQVAETLKILTENAEAVRDTLLTFDVWKNDFFTMKVQNAKSNDCHSCGEVRTYPYLRYENATKAEVLCGRNTVQIRPKTIGKINLDELYYKLTKLGKCERNPYLVSIMDGDLKVVFFYDGRAFIHGTNDMTKAKSVYYKYIG